MKIPTWVILVSICFLFFGGCDVISGLFTTVGPDYSEEDPFEKLEKLQSEFADDSTKAELDSAFNSESAKMQQEQLKKMVGESWFATKWYKVFAYIGILVGAFYFISGIFLLMQKDYAIKMAYIALGVSIGFTIVQMITMSMSSSGLLNFAGNIGFIFSISIDIILLIVIITADKSTFGTDDMAEV